MYISELAALSDFVLAVTCVQVWSLVRVLCGGARMLSNRESARRSRRRKQEHLTNMEIEISELAEDKRKWTEMRESLERRCESAEEESRKLREENSRLRDELRILGLVVGMGLISFPAQSTVQRQKYFLVCTMKLTAHEEHASLFLPEVMQ